MPLMWKIAAIPLRRAADHLLEVARAARHREYARIGEDIRNAAEISGKRSMTNEEQADSWDGGLYTVSYMLFGLSIENLAKAILVGKGGVNVGQNGAIKGLPKHHDLSSLLEQAGCAPSTEQRKVLDRTARYVVWQARYPTPLKAGEALPKKGDGGEWIEPGNSLPSAERDFLVLRSIWDQLAIAADAAGMTE